MIKRLVVPGLMLASVACGAKTKQAPTTPTSSGSVQYEDAGDLAQPEVAPESGGSVQEDQSQGIVSAESTSPLASRDSQVARGTSEGEATSADDPQVDVVPEVQQEELPRPPGQDLSPEQRQEIVAQHLKVATGALRNGDTEGAIREARQALEADEVSVEAMILLAHAFYLKEYNDKSEAILQIAMKSPAGEQNPTLLMLLGLVRDRDPLRSTEALTAYERVTELKPDYSAAWNNRGAIYLERKRYADAVASLEKSVSLDGRSSRAHANLGAAYRGSAGELGLDSAKREDLLRRGESSLRTALERDPTNASAAFNLGLLYLDADPYPGLETLPRLSAALRFLNEYKRLLGPRMHPGDPVDDYLAAAQKAYDREQKRQERKKKKDAESSQASTPSQTGSGGAP